MYRSVVVGVVLEHFKKGEKSIIGGVVSLGELGDLGVIKHEWGRRC
jgi:hypothetical protein